MEDKDNKTGRTQEKEKASPNIRSFFTNMSVPMPLSKKLHLVVRNNFTKLKTRQRCCGHPGQPGC